MQLLVLGDEMPLTILSEDYKGPPGLVAVIESPMIPPNTLVFIEDRKIVGIWDRTGTVDTSKRPHCDAIIHACGEGPEQMMGAKWVTEATAAARKKFN